MLPAFSVPPVSMPFSARARRLLAALAAGGALLVATGCGSERGDAGAAERVAADAGGSSATPGASASGAASASASASASVSPSASAKVGHSSSPSAGASHGATAKTGSSTGGTGGTGSGSTSRQSTAGSAPHFPVPVDVGNAGQIITVKASGSYATVTAWAKGPSGWKAQFSTSSARVGSNGVVDGSTRRQGTWTTPSGTYTLTQGFGVESSGTSMPYHVVTDTDWWVEDPQSAYYNSMHGEAGADFPLTESGDRGSEHLVDHPTQYAEALVIDYNRRPAVPGRGAGIFLHVNGSGATAGCVSVPRATMDRIMSWITPGNHPRIAIG